MKARMLVSLSCLSALALGCRATPLPAWGQFRGPNASGVALSMVEPLPDEIGPETNLVWSTELPPGHSSPVVGEDRVYVTAVDDKKLWTIALDRKTGDILWRREAPVRETEEIHSIGSLAQPSPATDGEHVAVFFGSSGLLVYDRAGELLWSKPMGPFKNNYGAASSPLIAGDRLILQEDHDEGSFVAAFDLHTGDEIWHTERAEFPRGFSTPILWNNDGETQVVCVGTLRVVGYDLETGKERFTVRGLGRIANPTPTVSSDGRLIVTIWAPGGDSSDRIDAPPYDELIARHDMDKDGTLEANEVPDGPLASRFPQIDRDKDGIASRAEYEDMRRIFTESRNRMVAIRPGARGEATDTHIDWTVDRFLPYVPSPIAWGDAVYMVKNGGVFTSIDLKTGEIVKSGRISGLGDYYASPVVGDGKIYLVSRDGDISVVRAAPEWEVLSSGALGETVFSTPAIANGCIYLRSENRLYCFGLEKDA